MSGVACDNADSGVQYLGRGFGRRGVQVQSHAPQYFNTALVETFLPKATFTPALVLGMARPRPGMVTTTLPEAGSGIRVELALGRVKLGLELA